MDLITVGVLAIIGLVSGFMAGLLGLGGGIIIIPMLLYGAAIPLKLATGISMVQAFFATVSAMMIHRRNRTVNVRLGVTLGIAGVMGALVGSFASASMLPKLLLSVYFSLVALSILLMFFAPKQERSGPVDVNLPLAFVMSLAVGVLAGMLGVGGGFIMMPLMISVLKIPTRMAVGTSLLMIIPTTFSGGIGKIATGQFDLQIAIFVIVGSIIGAQVGGKVNALASPKVIRTTLMLLLIGILIRTAFDLFGA